MWRSGMSSEVEGGFLVVAAGREENRDAELWVLEGSDLRLRGCCEQEVRQRTGAHVVDPGNRGGTDDDGNHDTLQNRIAGDERLQLQRRLAGEHEERRDAPQRVGTERGGPLDRRPLAQALVQVPRSGGDAAGLQGDIAQVDELGNAVDLEGGARGRDPPE